MCTYRKIEHINFFNPTYEYCINKHDLSLINNRQIWNISIVNIPTNQHSYKYKIVVWWIFWQIQNIDIFFNPTYKYCEWLKKFLPSDRLAEYIHDKKISDDCFSVTSIRLISPDVSMVENAISSIRLIHSSVILSVCEDSWILWCHKIITSTWLIAARIFNWNCTVFFYNSNSGYPTYLLSYK